MSLDVAQYIADNSEMTLQEAEEWLHEQEIKAWYQLARKREEAGE